MDGSSWGKHLKPGHTEPSDEQNPLIDKVKPYKAISSCKRKLSAKFDRRYATEVAAESAFKVWSSRSRRSGAWLWNRRTRWLEFPEGPPVRRCSRS